MNTSPSRSTGPREQPAGNPHRIQLPRSSTRVQSPYAYAKIVKAVRSYHWGGVCYDGPIYRPGAVVDRAAFPSPLVVIECAGPVGAFQRGVPREIRYILWQYDDATDEWQEKATAHAPNWSWTLAFRETVLAAIRPHPDLIDLIQRSHELTEAIVDTIDQRLDCEPDDVKHSALFAVYEAVAGRLAASS